MRPDDDDRDDDVRNGPPPLPPRKRRPVREVDEADDAPQGGVPKWVWGAVAFVGVLMLGSCVLGGIYVAGALKKAAREAEAENTPQGQPALKKKVYLRDEFRAVLMGKTADEVIAAVGKPNRTGDSGRMVFWYYDKMTKDPITGEVDSSAQVTFVDGSVASVSY